MTNRRFVAGAICPACGEIDKITVSMDRADKRRECVSCAYVDALPDESAFSEPQTRVSSDVVQAPPESPDSMIQILSLVDPAKPHNSN